MAQLALGLAVAATVGWVGVAHAKYAGEPVCDLAALPWHPGDPESTASAGDRPPSPQDVEASAYVSDRARTQVAELDVRARFAPGIATMRIHITARGRVAWLDATVGSERVLLDGLDLPTGDATIGIAAVDAAGRASREVVVAVKVTESLNQFASCFPRGPKRESTDTRNRASAAALGGISLVLVVILLAAIRWRSQSPGPGETVSRAAGARAVRRSLASTHLQLVTELGIAIALWHWIPVAGALVASYAAVDVLAAFALRRAAAMLACDTAALELRGSHLAVTSRGRTRTYRLGRRALAALAAIPMPAARAVR